MSSEITLSSFFCSLVVLLTLVCAKCVDDQTDREKKNTNKQKEVLLNCYGGISISFLFFQFDFFFSPFSFICVSIIIHTRNPMTQHFGCGKQPHTRTQPTIMHTQDVLHRWVNGILNGRPIGVFLTLKNIFESSSFSCCCSWCSPSCFVVHMAQIILVSIQW